MMGIRLFTITKTHSALYFVGGFFLFIMILFYCVTDRKSIFVTILILIHLLSASMYLLSNHLLILIDTLICLPIGIRFDNKRYGFSMLKFFLPGTLMVCMQLYGFKNLFRLILMFNKYLTGFLRFDLIEFIQNIVQGNYINEFNLMASVYNWALHLFEAKSQFGFNM